MNFFLNLNQKRRENDAIDIILFLPTVFNSSLIYKGYLKEGRQYSENLLENNDNSSEQAKIVLHILRAFEILIDNSHKIAYL